MKLSTKSRYAIMALIDMASHKEAKNITLSTLAHRQNLSLSYLEQLFSKLRRANILKSSRGVGGGYELAKSQSEIKIYDIILATEGPVKMLACSKKNSKGCNGGDSKCNSHKLWLSLEENLIFFLSEISLQDVVSGKLMQTQGNSRCVKE